MAKATLNDKILKKENEVENLKNQITKFKERLATATRDLQVLKDEKELNELLRLKDAFSSTDDVATFVEAVNIGDIETIKSLLSKTNNSNN